LRLFDIAPSGGLGARLAENLGIEVSAHEERVFEDTEFKIRPLENVRHQDVLVCQSFCADSGQSVCDRMFRLLYFIGALKDALATRVTVIAPYLSFQRKDQRTKPADPVSTRYLAQMLESVGLDRILTVDVHNLAAFENAFRCQKVHVPARPVLIEHCSSLLDGAARVVVVTPDVGGTKRARAFADDLAKAAGRPVDLAFVEKHRSEGTVSGDLFAGDVSDALVLILDDMICGGTTMARAAKACSERGARGIHLIATHGLFGGKAAERLSSVEIESIVVTDTIADAGSRCPEIASKLTVLETVPLIATELKGLVSP